MTYTINTTDLSADYSFGKNYLSFGGGVNSVALMLWLLDHNVEFEAVFADHGGDYPETYEYVDMLMDKGYEITILKPTKVIHGKTVDLYGECYEYKTTPSTRFRWCTSKYKVIPIRDYVKRPCFLFLGIAAEEAHRAKRNKEYEFGIIRDYPLIDHNINRQGCIEIIKAHGLPVPPKSGCFFCPFQKASEIRALYHRCDDLFDKALELEKRNVEYNKQKGKTQSGYLHISNRPLEVVAMTNQIELFEDMWPCACHD